MSFVFRYLVKSLQESFFPKKLKSKKDGLLLFILYDTAQRFSNSTNTVTPDRLKTSVSLSVVEVSFKRENQSRNKYLHSYILFYCCSHECF